MRQIGRKSAAEHGFTIIELMIATLVFSVVLLLVTVGVLQVNRVYYKGVTEANTQSVARSIIDTISQAIQFNGGAITPLPTPGAPVAGTQYYFCVNNQQFIYRQGVQLVSGVPGPGQTSQSLIQRTIAGACTPPGVVNGRELLSPKMRVGNLQVSRIGTTNLYKVQVRIIYGDAAVLNSPTSTTATCKSSQSGNQFCSVSNLTTVVEKRVN